MGDLTEAQINLLHSISGYKGPIWLRGERATTAISLCATKLIALGPSEDDGSVTAMITQEGRELVASRLSPARGPAEGAR